MPIQQQEQQQQPVGLSDSKANLTSYYYNNGKAFSRSSSIEKSPPRRIFPVKNSPPVQIYDLGLLEYEPPVLSSSLMSSSSMSSASFFLGSSFSSSKSSSFSFSRSTSLMGNEPFNPDTQLKSSSNNAYLTNYHASPNDEAFTFQDFISEIINENGEECHQLITQDLARVLELKFREFKANPTILDDTKSQSAIDGDIANLNIGLESELISKIASRIFELANEEPNGIMGARIRMRFMFDGGRVYDMCPTFAYDSSTLATSEITVTIREDVRKFKRLLQKFKLYSNVGKFFSVYIDQDNYIIESKKLY